MDDEIRPSEEPVPPPYREQAGVSPTISSFNFDFLRERALSHNITLPLTQYPHPGTSPSSSTPPPPINNLNNPYVQFKGGPGEDPRPFPSPSRPMGDPRTAGPRIADNFYQALLARNTEVVTGFVRAGLVSPDMPNMWGETPLNVAVCLGDGQLVCTLVSLGASVDLLARYDHSAWPWDPAAAELKPLQLAKREATQRLTDRLRTPLMVAAARGNLALVKLLVGDFKADDAIIAPDGQLALRLAAEGRHREIVEYLPARRGGEWHRWKTHHDVAVRRVRRLGRKVFDFWRFFLWTVPKFLAWDVPKHVVVLPVRDGAVWAWKNKKHFRGWCRRQMDAMPDRVERLVKRVGKGARAVGRGLKKLPETVKRFMVWLWGCVKSIPAVMKLVGVWIWETLKKVGAAVGEVFLKVVSAIHTALMAVLDFFRKIKLRDVWNGICNVFRAVLVSLPKAIWSGIEGFVELMFNAMKTLFGCTGKLIWLIFVALVWVVIYVPRQLWKMVWAMGGSIAKGYHEFMVWVNPKHGGI